ncbi:phosphate ABC transporter permease PstA [Vibrio salinus]|uniref:phosphate ABC transporter permease PstA n=1 Tax=Vibrio salinus TaxID=2899784 RepID=UPI001E503973|nr:phosphate ABC transporter permease PstA [Vibrio salinus]MCE0493197.1 phosphate ABC transporter permease PstA [Vibrio salinus]
MRWFRSGAPWIWLTGGAVSFCLLAVMGLLLLIGWKGLIYFWPSPLYEWHTSDNRVVVGQLYDTQSIPLSHIQYLPDAKKLMAKGEDSVERFYIKIANRELLPLDFTSLFDYQVISKQQPKGWIVLDRVSNGQLYGKPVSYHSVQGTSTDHIRTQLEAGIEKAHSVRAQIARLIEDKVQKIGSSLESLRTDRRKRELNGTVSDEYLSHYEVKSHKLNYDLTQAEKKLDELRGRLKEQWLTLEYQKGKTVSVPIREILDAWYPNDMSLMDKMHHWGHEAWIFLTDNPRESNSEGGVFPAIFGTILLVILMSLIVMPLGVIAAVYLHEYARDNVLTRVIRVAVINLAGVPSIVYGVFGLGFFVYTIGSGIDRLFYAENLPVPTFGTPGLLWSALTLAVLTLPVVIVATEEGLSRIPMSVRHGSMALGATQFETMMRIVLPMASPAIITGMILAIARAAGEVAPLMLVGVVKYTSDLPVDNEFPYLHLERKFMHLGFHIYDVGFQTSNIEVARPLVFATAFLLVAVIVTLNLTAIGIRNNLREKYRTLGQD